LSLIARLGAIGGCCVLLAQCGQTSNGRFDPKYGVSSSPRLVALGEPVPKGGGVYRVGKPYTIGGQTYEPSENSRYSAEGLASWYGEDFHGRATANGEIYDMASITAAHPTLPIPSYARVTNLNNHKSIIVRVNDRGPYHANRLIDVSVRTARLLGFYDRGITRVRVDYVGRAALEGSDDTKLASTLRTGTPAPGPAEVRLASTRLFVPHSPEPLRGSVPVPADRPFDLGHAPDTRTAQRPPASDVAAITRQPIAPVAPVREVASAATPRPASRQTASSERASAPGSSQGDQWERGFAARFAPANSLGTVPATNGPMSAFAGPAPSNGAIVSGRGLY
jgi:peptidoglycan lytic transglycosylase